MISSGHLDIKGILRMCRVQFEEKKFFFLARDMSSGAIFAPPSCPECGSDDAWWWQPHPGCKGKPSQLDNCRDISAGDIKSSKSRPVAPASRDLACRKDKPFLI